MNIEQNTKLLYMGSTYKLLGEKRKKKYVGRKKKRIRAFAHLSLELSPFTFSSTAYQPIELTYHIGPQSVYVSRALLHCGVRVVIKA